MGNQFQRIFGVPGLLPAAPRMRSLAVLLGACATLSLLPIGEASARRPVKPPAASGSFVDVFDAFDSQHWSKADGWTNGSPFDNAWLADHVGIANGQLDLRLDDVATLGQPYASGELRSNGFYGYGCYEASFRPVALAGVITSLFTFAGPYDDGGNGRHNEIDVEFVGLDTTRVQLNFWANDDAYASRNEALVELGFDASQQAHRYGFKWTPARIDWFVDGNLVYSAIDRPDNPIPKAEQSLQKVMVNVWPVDETAELWAGAFQYPGHALHASYDWIRHIAGSDCELDTAPLDPPPDPPPSGDPATVHVADIALRLDARSTQVIAAVSIVDGTGQAASGAAVNGQWSGLITGGDSARTTGGDGVATFYSARSRAAGEVRFCVTGVARDGFQYEPAADLATCETIVK
jgi:endo-1,3-1,4-beta-glycanase ExoK